MVAVLHHLQRSDTAAAIMREIARHPLRYSQAKPAPALRPAGKDGTALVIYLPSMEEIFERINRALAGAKGLRNGAAKLARRAARDRLTVIPDHDRLLHVLEMQQMFFGNAVTDWERSGGIPANVLALAMRAFMEFDAVRDDLEAMMEAAFRPEPMVSDPFDMQAMLS